MKHILPSLLCSAALALVPVAASAMVITPTDDAFGLANTLFLNSSGLFIQDAEIASGSSGQLGTYQNTSGTLGLPLTGIVLSSGNVNDILSDSSTGYDVAATDAENALLAPITGQDSHFDVADLVIDFYVADNVSSVTFFASFLSTEWPEFVSSSYNDGFGLLVNGVNVAGVQTSGGGENLPVNIDHPDMVAFADSVGVLAPNENPVLRFDVPVNSGQVNTFSIIIADASDSILDTGVFISSFFPTEGGGGDDGTGLSEFTPLLPSNPPDPLTGTFVIELPLDVPDNQIVWIDPPVSTGFVYELNGEGAFASVTAPSLASVADLDGYLLTVGATTVSLAAGASLDFEDVFGVTPTSFTLTGIDPLLGLDPDDGSAFPLGVSFVGLGPNATISQTPITVETSAVPLPAAAWLMLAALGGLSLLRRRHPAA